MIDIKDLKSRAAVQLLRGYKGINPYLKELKAKLLKNDKIKLTEGQVIYLNEFHDVVPQIINKVVRINALLGKTLQEKDKLSFLPEKILIQAILADQEKTYHVYGKLKQNQKHSKMYWLPKTLVLDDPYFTECDINVEWDKYIEADILGRIPYDHQKSGVEFLLCRDGAILADDMGLGKAISISELVYCPNGKVKMGDIKIGDYVIGSDGKKTKVLEIHPQDKKEMFKITFNDGYSTICCKEHMWTVTSNNGSVNNKDRPVRYSNLTIEQMLDEELEVEQIGFGWNEKRPYKFKTYYKQSNGQNKWQIPIVKPIKFENNYSLPIEPYLLGVSLGDGHINLKEESKILNLNGTLSHTKFIPEIYKYSSIEDRLSILQGLMDTDGYCMKSKNGNFTGTEYCSVSEQLVDDVAEIVHSLGGIVRKKSKMGSYKKEDGTKVLCKRAYRLNIKLPEGMNPFRLKRKADEYNTLEKYKIGRYIEDISSVGEGESVCIKVDAEDSLFTLNHGIVTHNTYQSIVAALEKDAKKVLIVCPASVKISWQREVENFGETAIIVNGSKWPSVGRFTIINYDILKNFHTIGPQTKDKNGELNIHHREIINENYDLIILDEAHKVKDHKSQRGKIINDVTIDHGIDNVWLLTGTPIANRPMDFFNLLKLVGSPLASNWKFFAQRYCDAKRFYKKLKSGVTKQIWITNGASNLDELSIRTKNNLLRRLKNEVLDMPDKTITTNYHTLSKRGLKEYENLWDEYVEQRAEDGKRKIGDLSKDIVELGLLRKFIAMETIPHTIELTKDAIEQGQKVVIFTTFTDELEEIAECFGKECVIHNGKMTTKAKQKSVDSFQNNKKTKVFIGNITSAGVGITLTEGTVVIFNSFSWVPGDNEQAEDRCVFGNQLVMTNSGYKKIEDIIIGDKVYTHKGNFKYVIDKHSHLEREKIKVDIDAFGHNSTLSVTHDHKIYVYNEKNNEFKWVEAGEINILNERLTFPINKMNSKRKKFLKVKNYIKPKFKNNHNALQKNSKLIKLKTKVELTNDLLYAFGFYVADGWCNISGGKNSNVNVCQKITNKKMYDASEYIIKIFKESFNIETHSNYVDKNDVKTCTLYSKNLVLNFKNWFGLDIYSKQLPKWVDELNEEQLKSLLSGYYHGDGYKRKNTQQASTASIKLANQLVRYNINLGRPVSFSKKGMNNYSIEYTIDENLNNRIKKVGDYMTYSIKKLSKSKPKRGEERVYDLSVEDDHSFIVGNYNVHNCYRIGQLNNVSVYYQLFSGTISLVMWYTLMKKQQIINKIIAKNDEHGKRLQMLIEDLNNNGLSL